MKKTGDKTRYCCLITWTNTSLGPICLQKSRASAHRNDNSKALIHMSVRSIFLFWKLMCSESTKLYKEDKEKQGSTTLHHYSPVHVENKRCCGLIEDLSASLFLY